MKGKVRLPGGLCAFLLCAFILAGTGGSVRADGFRVVAVDVQGAKRVPPDDIRQAMSTRVGQELDLARIREDIKAISRMGYFRGVTIDSEEVEGGYRLTVVVSEKPVVASVAIEGNKDVDLKDLKEGVTVKERSLFQEEKVKESVNNLREIIKNNGFIDAEVESVVSEDAEGAIRVTFRIAEGEKLKIEKIVVEGNLYFSRKQILKAMETNEEGFFSFITNSGVYKKDVLENDVMKLEALYQNAGFLDSKISDPQFDRGKEGLVLTLRIYEGRQYRIGTIRFSGESGVSEETLRKTVKLKSGDLFNREILLSDLLALTTLVNDQGYAQALVSPGLEKRKEYPVADLTYRIERGRMFHFGKVEIAGNTKTFDRVVRRSVDVAEGATYSATKLKTTKENLTRTSYYKDVKVTTAPADNAAEMDVKVEIQEAPTGTLSGGMGYSSMDGIFGVVQLSENNLFGRGWKASLNSQFGSRRTSFTLDFRNPHLFDTDYSLLTTLYNNKIEYEDFKKDSKGGRIGVGYNLSRFLHGSVSFALDDTKVLPVENELPEDIVRKEIEKGKQKTRSLIVSATRNTTDRYIDPSKGTVQSVSVQYAGGPLGGDTQFLKYILNAKAFYPVTASTVLSASLLWGHVVSTDGGWGKGEVPLYERFFLGGPYSIRGFRSRTLSPIDPNTGEKVGGNKDIIGNVEYQFPLGSDTGFKGVFFVDAGNTWRQGAWPFVDERIWIGYGTGVRWYSPMGPMRFEYGWNLNRPPGAPASVFEFTIGTVF
ncbi:MAG: outer membrane protein assembly factor BamA [Thermodesulfobacteriota bacterium]